MPLHAEDRQHSQAEQKPCRGLRDDARSDPQNAVVPRFAQVQGPIRTKGHHADRPEARGFLTMIEAVTFGFRKHL